MKHFQSSSHRCCWALATALGIGGTLGLFSLLNSAPAVEAQGRAPMVLPNEYIVVLKDTVPDPPAVASEMARRHGLGLHFAYGAALKGFSATIPPARLAAVARDPRISYVEQDQLAFAISQTTPTGISRIYADQSSTLAGDGSGSVNVGVAVIDTGIQPDHPDLNVVGGINFSSNKPALWIDGNGHGTHVAGTIGAMDNDLGVVGVAPGAPLWAVKVLNNGGSGTWSGIIAGIDWVAANAAAKGIRVANMSLGGGKSNAVNDAVNKAVTTKNVVFAVAAGNSSADAAKYSPASAVNAITVAALSDADGEAGGNDTFASFSNYGSLVDLIAPGVNILSTWKGGGYNTISGTSMATPHVAGAAALYLSTDGTATAAQVRDALVNNKTEDIAGPGRSYPLLNVTGF